MGLKTIITKDDLLQKVGDRNIFNFYFGDFKVSKSYHSCFRQDIKKSSAFIISKDGDIIYKDFALNETYDCISFVMRLLGLKYHEAVKQIAVDFNLIPGERSKNKEAIVHTNLQNKKKEEKRLRVDAVRFKKHHLEYWAQYGITAEELIKNNIYAVTSLYINEWRVPVKSPEILRFAYLIKKDGRDYLKIYTPYASDYKWVTNAPLNVPWGIDELPNKSNTLIITKSLKDKVVLNKYFTDVIALQNESMSALDKDVALALKKCYKHIYIWFDCDRPGIKAANAYKKAYGFTPIFVGDFKKSIWARIMRAKKIRVKDPSDFIARYGLETFENYLKHINLING
jgi:DNA primase